MKNTLWHQVSMKLSILGQVATHWRDIMLTNLSILSSVTNWEVFCSYVHFNASSESRDLGASQDRS